MKRNVKQYLAALLTAAMVVTALPLSVVKAAGGGDVAAGGTAEMTLDGPVTVEESCVKFVKAGTVGTRDDDTDSVKSVLVGTNNYNSDGNEKAAARIDGVTAKGTTNLGSTRVAAMAFELPEKAASGDSPAAVDPDLIVHAEVAITVFDGNQNLNNGVETKAAVFQVDASKFDGLADDTAENATGTTFPAKDNKYGKENTIFSKEWISRSQTRNQKVTFDVTDWVKKSIESGDKYAIYRLQTVVGGYYVYPMGSDKAPKLSITTATEEQLKKQTLDKDYATLQILNADDVRGNLPLIKKGLMDQISDGHPIGQMW